MKFRLLGPLEVEDAAGRAITIGRLKHRLLLALLLINANRSVPAERLVHNLWGDSPPRSARANLNTYAWSLRALLHQDGKTTSHIRTVGDGYAIDVAQDQIDVLRFEMLLTDGCNARQRGESVPAEALFGEALSLWHGAALQDLRVGNELVATAHRLEEMQLVAFEELIDTRLELGHHAHVIGDLQIWTSKSPFQERLCGQLMTALYRDGRQTEALDVYQRFRQRLIEEIGVEPEPALQDLQHKILAHDLPSAASRRRQAGMIGKHDDSTREPLPADTFEHFTEPASPRESEIGVVVVRQLPRNPMLVGRAEELAQLHKHLMASPSWAASVVVVSGAAGVGKSALALRTAHESAARYPHGQLYVNLCGANPSVGPLVPLKVLGRFLRALSVPAEEVPMDVEEAAALFRSLTSTRKMLVVLDDAHSAAQVRPLLPSGPGNTVLITSRTNLSHLDATSLHLGPLGREAAADMLDQLTGDDRCAVEPAVTMRLAELCGWLPLALRVAGARLSGQPHLTVDELVTRLEDEDDRLDELAAGDIEVRRSLAVSYNALDTSDDRVEREAARALRHLGQLRTPDIGLDSVVALLGGPRKQAELIIQRLTERHLVNISDHGRYTLHDLVRLFAREKAAEKTLEDQWHAAHGRLLEYYVATTRLASNLVYPHRERYLLPAVDVAPKPLVNPGHAKKWLDTEGPGLIDVASQALAEENARLGVALAHSLYWFLSLEGDPEDSVTLHRNAVNAARRLEDQSAEANSLDHLAAAFRRMEQFDEACAAYQQELAIQRQLGNGRGECRALGNLSISNSEAGRPAEALRFSEKQLIIAKETRWETAQTHAYFSLGYAHYALGHLEKSAEQLTIAQSRARESGDDYYEAAAIGYLALIRVESGQGEGACELLRRGLPLSKRSGDRRQETFQFLVLARAYVLARNLEAARSTMQEAMMLLEELPSSPDALLLEQLDKASADVIDEQQ